MSEVLTFANVRCGYVEGAWAVDGAGFGLAAGEVVGLVGRNGAGKTTLMRLALGMLAPEAGKVAVFGRDPLADPVAVKSRLGYVAEDQILPPFLRVEDAVRQHRELFPGWDAGLERELRARFALDGRARIGSLSKGQARQVALLCAVCRRPELLLLDEPAGGLDPVARREFLETAIRLLNDTGTAILFSSHHLADLERLARRVVLLHRGRVRLDADLDELREGCALAILPLDGAPLAEEAAGWDGCLSARRRPDGLHLLLRREASAARAWLAAEKGQRGAHCVPVGLEELFVELTSDDG